MSQTLGTKQVRATPTIRSADNLSVSQNGYTVKQKSFFPGRVQSWAQAVETAATTTRSRPAANATKNCAALPLPFEPIYCMLSERNGYLQS